MSNDCNSFYGTIRDSVSGLVEDYAYEWCAPANLAEAIFVELIALGIKDHVVRYDKESYFVEITFKDKTDLRMYQLLGIPRKYNRVPKIICKVE